MLQRLTVRTRARESLVDITEDVQQAVAQAGVAEGTALLFVPHTTCGITIQENADPGVQHDMLMVLRRIYPRDDPGYRHIEDNSASHLQASTMGFSPSSGSSRKRMRTLMSGSSFSSGSRTPTSTLSVPFCRSTCG